MRLSRKKAIALCIELWEWLAETGEEWKADWPGWKKYGNICWSHCWFCEYSNRKLKNDTGVECRECPLSGKDFECDRLYYGEWKAAKTPHARKKYAKLFLEQIKSIE